MAAERRNQIIVNAPLILFPALLRLLRVTLKVLVHKRLELNPAPSALALTQRVFPFKSTRKQGLCNLSRLIHREHAELPDSH